MPSAKLINRVFTSELKKSMAAKVTVAVSVCVFAFGASPVSAGSLSRSMDVDGTPAEVWSKIGSFCAIKDWHPAIGTCTDDGKAPPTRTLVTKDGKATFVELQTKRSDRNYLYSYSFLSSPLPVTNYTATIEVTAKGRDTSTVTWSGAYTPAPGKEKDANDALTGIYESGLAAIKTKLAK